MIINPTKKTLPLFSAIPKVENLEEAKAFSQANPLFSWHATYFTVERKKILLLINDQVNLAVVFADINAKNKQDLAAVIKAGISQIFKDCDISKKQINEYFRLAGAIEVGAAFDRSVMGVMTMWIQIAKDRIETDPLTSGYQDDLTWDLACIPIVKDHGKFSQKSLRLAFEKGLKLQPVGLTVSAKKPHEKTWEDYGKWFKYEGKGWFDDYETVADEVRANNRKLLDAFADYLRQNEQLSAKDIESHVEHVQFYINDYLFTYQILTPVSAECDPLEFLGSWFTRKYMWASADSVRSFGASLNNFTIFSRTAARSMPRN